MIASVAQPVPCWPAPALRQRLLFVPWERRRIGPASQRNCRLLANLAEADLAVLPLGKLGNLLDGLVSAHLATS